jgi:hypothetical protein
MAFVTQFAATEGQTSYSNNVLIGARIKVFREGVYQYTQSGVNYIIRVGATILFVPALVADERIRIQTIE